jgi:hypothetical protein
MTEPLILSSPKDNLINKPVHTRDGFLIGRIHIIDNGSIVVARGLVATIFYRIPTQSQGINLNTYVNQIIKRFIEWDKFEPKAKENIYRFIKKDLLTRY